ncbi:hypothetical protein [Vibrio rotiferianus]|uniref:hypothetical protein n=1 Tax=Vibrio rotiferianus TaxID=190895 RepID=UPI00390AB7DC
MHPISIEERNTCIVLICDYFQKRGIHLIPNMFIESGEACKFLFEDTWLEYVMDIEDLPIKYAVDISSMSEPSRLIINITNNGGIEHVVEYETFDIPLNLMKDYIADPEGYKQEIQKDPAFRNWL